jgi:hypothetical protein
VARVRGSAEGEQEMVAGADHPGAAADRVTGRSRRIEGGAADLPAFVTKPRECKRRGMQGIPRRMKGVVLGVSLTSSQYRRPYPAGRLAQGNRDQSAPCSSLQDSESNTDAPMDRAGLAP